MCWSSSNGRRGNGRVYGFRSLDGSGLEEGGCMRCVRRVGQKEPRDVQLCGWNMDSREIYERTGTVHDYQDAT